MKNVFGDPIDGDCHFLDPTSVEELLELLKEIQTEVNSIVDYSTLNKGLKNRLSILMDRTNRFLRSADFHSVPFDAGVHRAMLSLAAVAKDEHERWITVEQRKKVVSLYQQAAEEYVMHHRRKP